MLLLADVGHQVVLARIRGDPTPRTDGEIDTWDDGHSWTVVY